MLPSNLQKRIVFDPSGCWLWTGAKMQGYGWVGINGKSERVHATVYKIFIGPIPEGTELHHVCENRACCNPDHLEPITRKAHKALHPKTPPTHCKNGHPFSGDNLVISINASHPGG